MAAKGRIRIQGRLDAGAAVEVEGDILGALMEWRPRPGEAFTVSGPGGQLFRARLVALGDARATLLPFEEMGEEQSGPEMTLLQALPERERMETVIQKTTELGISSILPFKSEKSISIEELDGRQRRSHNWGNIALKAARQSRRPDIPEVLSCVSFPEALRKAQGFGLKVMLREGAKAHLKDVLRDIKGPVERAALLVGPEGGLTDEETATAAKEGFVAVNLGLRILRTETAAILGTGLMRYELSG